MSLISCSPANGSSSRPSGDSPIAPTTDSAIAPTSQGAVAPTTEATIAPTTGAPIAPTAEAQIAPKPVTFDAKRAWAHLQAQVAIGPRPAGSAALNKTRDYIQAQLKTAGITSKLQVFIAKT